MENLPISPTETAFVAERGSVSVIFRSVCSPKAITVEQNLSAEGLMGVKIIPSKVSLPLA
jgi:hypothetical protein